MKVTDGNTRMVWLTYTKFIEIYRKTKDQIRVESKMTFNVQCMKLSYRNTQYTVCRSIFINICETNTEDTCEG